MRGWVLGGLFVVGLTVACASSDDAGSVSPEKACDDLARAYCEKIQECAPFLMSLSFGATATCIDRIKIECVPGFSANGTSANPSTASQCATEASAATCDALLGRTPPQSCKTQPGQLANGVPCGTNAQCAGRRCKPIDNKSCGVCTALAGANGDCTEDADCDDALSCRDGKCKALGGANATCNKESPCLPTFGCVEGKCQTPLEAGAACVPAVGTGLDPNPCNAAKGLFCHPQNRVCAKIEAAAPGAACGLVNGALVACAGSDCKIPSGVSVGACVAKVADGAACKAGETPSCQSPAKCVDGRCTIGDPSACK